jgi:hypothetical protein
MPTVFRLIHGSARRFYAVARRPQLKQQNPGWAFGEFGMALGAEWAQMTDKQKAKYVAMNEKDQRRYQHEMAAY